jgi:preprotein translocase subunit SecE
MVDNVKLVIAALFAVAGLWGYYALADSATLLRLLPIVGGVAAGLLLAWFTEPGRRFVVFARESLKEVQKVVWPTRKETIQTTATVFAFVVVMAVFLWISDKSLEWVLYDLILGWKKT